MVDEARFVAAAAAIDNAAVIEAEEIRVIERAFGIGPVLRDFPQNAFTLVFNDACTGFYCAPGENTGAVDSRSLDDIKG